MEMRQAIATANVHINDIALVMAPLKAKEADRPLTPEETNTLAIYNKSLNAAIQGMLNTYDDSCSKYLDGKIDKVRFKKNFHYEIRNLLESEDLKVYFNPTTSRYKPILKVYDEWENLER